LHIVDGDAAFVVTRAFGTHYRGCSLNEAPLVDRQSFSRATRVRPAARAMLRAKLGNRQGADADIAEAIRVGKNFIHFHHTAYAVGSAYVLMNDHQQALKWLQRAVEDGLPCYPMYENDPILNNLQKDPHFIEFLAQQKRQWEQYRATL